MVVTVTTEQGKEVQDKGSLYVWGLALAVYTIFLIIGVSVVFTALWGNGAD